jgi:mono/diheme cytochrome c family protein
MIKRILRVLGILLAAIVGLAALAALVVYAVSESRLRTNYQVAVEPISIPTDAATIERGRQLAFAAHCVGCHASNLSGQTLIDAPPFRIVPPNLTSGAGGVGARYTDADWVRAIRHGVRPDGSPLQIMPSHNFNKLSAADLAAIIAFVKSAPAVDNQPGATELRALGRLLMVLGEYSLPAEQIDHRAPFPAAVPFGRTPEYGRYLATIGNCRDCHGGNLSGMAGIEPGSPPAANLTPGGALSGWSEADFIHALRTGTRPGGSQINPAMPWELSGQLSDDELGALYLYLQSLPALPFNTPVE